LTFIAIFHKDVTDVFKLNKGNRFWKSLVIKVIMTLYFISLNSKPKKCRLALLTPHLYEAVLLEMTYPLASTVFVVLLAAIALLFSGISSIIAGLRGGKSEEKNSRHTCRLTRKDCMLE